MRILTAGVGVLLASALLAGCDAGGGGAPGTGGSGAPAGPTKKSYTLYYVPKMGNNVVFNYALTAAKRRAAELGNVAVEMLAPTKGDPVEQASIVRALVGQKVDGILVSCNEPNTLQRAIDEAVGAGVPLICFDSDSPQSKRAYVYANNDVKAGRILAEELVKRMGPAGDVLIQSGGPGADNLNKRIQGVKEVFAGYPRIQIRQTLFCEDDVAKAIEQIAGAMNANPDTKGVILVGGWALFGKNALDPIDPAKTTVISFDALEPEWQYLENGKCAALVAQDVYGWGYKGVDILMHVVDPSHPLPAEPDARGLIEAKVEVVTKDTLDAYKKKWNAWFGKKSE